MLKRGARVVVYALGAVLLATAWWTNTTFGDVTVEQLLFHIRFGGGLANVPVDFARDFLTQVLIYPVACALAFTAIEALWDLRRERSSSCTAGSVRRATRRNRWGRMAGPIFALLTGLFSLAHVTHASEYLASLSTTEYFASMYKPPSHRNLQVARRPKNLVLIYAESMETTLASESAFGRNLLQPLTELGGVSFNHYVQMPGTGWTIAAIVSTQCGVPLKAVGLNALDVLEGDLRGKGATTGFLSGANCLSDLLHEQGYRNVFLGGAPLSFAGKGQFLAAHHYDEAWGRSEWVKSGVPLDRISGWGLHDDDLLAAARMKLRELHETGSPFQLTILTVDTHMPHGQLSRECQQRGASRLDDIYACSARQIADFIRFVRDAGYDVDTNVAVMGDHLAMTNTLQAQLESGPQRHIFNAFFARKAPVKNREDIVHFDMLPTLLEFIGFRTNDGRVGLGTSGFSRTARVPEASERLEMARALPLQSKAYEALWTPSRSPSSVVPSDLLDADP